MPLFFITHELSHPHDHYAPFWDRLEEWGAVRILDSGWIVPSASSAVQLLEDLRGFLDPNDRLFIVELSQTFAWMNMMADPYEAWPA